MSLGPKEAESNEFLFQLMDKLETVSSDSELSTPTRPSELILPPCSQMKGELSSNEAVTDDAAASAYIENFALRIFSQADNEDRTAKATR